MQHFSDSSFLQMFEDCTLPKEYFKHRDHVRLAFLYLQQWPFYVAVDKFTSNLQKYATSLGAKDKYHQVMSIAYLAIIKEKILLEENPAALSWEEFALKYSSLWEGPHNILQRLLS